MKREHVSASSISTFECPVRWVTNYDEERHVSTRSSLSDAGVLIHATLERFRDPDADHEDTYEVFDAIFEQVCADHIFAESLSAYKYAKKILPSAYRMTQVHPTIPIHLAVSRAVEQELIGFDGQLWRMDSWPLPMKGSIDWVATIESSPGEHVLFIEDTKSGRPKTHEELTSGEDVQPAIYILYARNVLVPWFQSQGINIVRIVMSWTYVADGSAVPMYESDFDHDITEKYVANISQQMLNFEKLYNDFLVDLEVHAGGGAEDDINEWFSKHEKPNRYCSYCPRSKVCQTFNRLLRYEATISLSGEIDWKAFFEEYESYQKIEKAANTRLERMKETIKVYIEQEKLDSIPIGDTGKQFVATPQTRDKVLTDKVIELLGSEFILKNAVVTKKDIDAEIARIALENPERAKEIEEGLPAVYIPAPYSRPVRITKVSKEK